MGRTCGETLLREPSRKRQSESWGAGGVKSHTGSSYYVTFRRVNKHPKKKKTPKPKTKRQDLINIFHNKTQLVAKGPCSVPHQSPFTCQTSSPSHRNPRWMLYSLLGNVTVHFLYTTCFLEPAFKPRGHALLPLPIGEGTSTSKER